MKLTFEFVSHLSGPRQHFLMQRCVEYPQVHREIVTQYRRGHPVGASKTFYFVDVPFDPAEYATAADALAALDMNP